MSLLKKMINSHVEWDSARNVDRHAQDIAELRNAYSNCVRLHQKKCTDKEPICGDTCKEVCKSIGKGVTAIIVCTCSVFVPVGN